MSVLDVQKQVEAAVWELCSKAQLPTGSLLVVGCSSSEILGNSIGCTSSPEVGQAVYEAAQHVLIPRDIFLVAQCCEHLNRALVVERSVVEKYWWAEEVNAVPHTEAGGSFATAAYKGMTDPLLVETMQAHAGIDIGGTLIGMHLRRVASPVRLEQRQVGEAWVTAARSRPKYIGGDRTNYNDALAHTPDCPAKH